MRSRWTIGMAAGVVVALASGCSAEADSETPTQKGGSTFPKNECVTAGAAYKQHYDEQSGGSCGPVADAILNVPANGQISTPECIGKPRYEGCSVFIENILCNTGGSTVKQNGKMDWAADGSSGHGFITLVITAPGYDPCTSTYEVTAVRL